MASQHPQALAAARWRRRHPGRHEVAVYMSKYGLTRQQAEVALVSAQGGMCASCGKFAKLLLDHDHVTGKARGMVCYSCNTVAGSLEHPKRQIVQNYLDHSKGTP